MPHCLETPPYRNPAVNTLLITYIMLLLYFSIAQFYENADIKFCRQTYDAKLCTIRFE